jgi:high affinity sulfate transporter 1
MGIERKRGVDRILPGLAALRAYDRSLFRFDIAAGLSVAAVAVPIAIAYAQLAGAPPVNGLYASLLPLVTYAFLGSSRQLILAPDAATCAIVASTLLPLAGSDPTRYVSLSMVLSVMTGVMCIVAGVARLGFLTNFLARPILTGYLNGIALSIISGQLGRLFGYSVDQAGFFRLLKNFAVKLGETHWQTLVVGLSILVLLQLLKHLASKVPAPLVAVALGIAATWFFDLGSRGVALVGAIPAGLPRLMIPAVGVGDLEDLALAAVGIALISFNSAMVTAESFAVKNRYELDSNQEFIALGVADVGAGILQGFPISGADSRTAVNDSVGGKTQVTGLVAAGVLVLVLLFFTGPLSLLPIAVLAAVLINSALSLFDVQSLLRLRRIRRPEFRLSLATTLGVITLGVLPGVLIAVGLAIIQLLKTASRPADAVLGRIPGLDGYHNVEGQVSVETIPGLIIYRFDASLLFFNSGYFKGRVRMVLEEAKTKPQWFLLDAESMPLVDTTGAATLEELRSEMAEKGVVVAVARMRKAPLLVLERAGLRAQIGPERFFPTLPSAVAAFLEDQRVAATRG